MPQSDVTHATTARWNHYCMQHRSCAADSEAYAMPAADWVNVMCDSLLVTG